MRLALLLLLASPASAEITAFNDPTYIQAETIDCYGNKVYVDSPTFTVDCSNNRVGISTASPSHTLQVAGAIKSTAAIVTGEVTAGSLVGPLTGNVTGNVSGSAGTVPAAGVNAGNLGASVVASSIAIGAVHPAAVTAGTYGNITGLGTLSSLAIQGDAAGYLLDILETGSGGTGAADLEGQVDNGGAVQIRNNSESGSSIRVRGADATVRMELGWCGSSCGLGRASVGMFRMVAADPISFNVTSPSNLVIAANGRVGISTGSPTAQLSVIGHVDISSGITTASGTFSGNVAAATFTGDLTGAVTGNASTASALAANGANCSANSFPLGVDASGAVESCSTSISGNSATATALAANGGNCSAGSFPIGVDASGAVESCTDSATQSELDTHAALTNPHSATAANTVDRIVLRDGSGNFAAGTVTAALSGNATTATALAANGANCSSGSYPLGVDASGAVESCTSAGVGDALLAGNQTFTGTNAFSYTNASAAGVSLSTAIALSNTKSSTAGHLSYDQTGGDLYVSSMTVHLTGWKPWTPTVTQVGAVTITIAYARYIQVGKMITASFYLSAMGTGGTTANDIVVGGLPFAAATSGENFCVGSFAYLDSGTARYSGAVVMPTTTTLKLLQGGAIGSHFGTTPNMTPAAGDNFGMTITYEVP